jgi:hypothetical protein
VGCATAAAAACEAKARREFAFALWRGGGGGGLLSRPRRCAAAVYLQIPAQRPKSNDRFPQTVCVFCKTKTSCMHTQKLILGGARCTISSSTCLLSLAPGAVCCFFIKSHSQKQQPFAQRNRKQTFAAPLHPSAGAKAAHDN